MFISESQVIYLASIFTPKLNEESISAMTDVASNGLSILSSAEKHKVTHQSLVDNLTKLIELQSEIANTGDLFSSSYLLKETALALLMSDILLKDAKPQLIELCENLGGEVELGDSAQEVKLYLENTITSIITNPDSSYEREWNFEQNDSE